jgi:hypothetical protein
VKDIHKKYCCECDYCGVSACDKTPAEAVVLSDYPQNHYLFCWEHRVVAFAAIRAYIAAHPGVTIEDDGSWREELAAEYSACRSIGVEGTQEV